MRTNNIFILVVLMVVGFMLFSKNALAKQITIHPKHGQGLVQMAEEHHVSVREFVKINRDRLVNKKHPELIYAWQEFILPSSNQVLSSSVQAKLPNVKKIVLPAPKNIQITNKVDKKDVSEVPLTGKIFSYLKTYLNKKIAAIIVICVFISTFLFALLGGLIAGKLYSQKFKRHFVCKSKGDGGFVLKEKVKIYEFKTQGEIKEIARFIHDVYGREFFKYVSFSIPKEFASEYVPLNKEERVLFWKHANEVHLSG